MLAVKFIFTIAWAAATKNSNARKWLTLPTPTHVPLLTPLHLQLKGRQTASILKSRSEDAKLFFCQ
jgi:hypothetical protein